MILLHGSGPGATGWSNFSGNIEALAKQFHVYAVDMPGWGQSDPATVEQLDHVDAAIQFMDALGIERAAFVGNSMGGQTSLRLATEHPDRITHLVTMGPPVGRMPTLFGAGDGPSEGLKVLIHAYRDPSPEHMRRLVEIMVYDKARFATPELCQARAEAAQMRPEHLHNYVAGLPAGAPLPKWVRPELLPAIKTPTLLIHGRDDRVVSFETSLYLLANIPDSRLVLLNRCGHWAMIEHPDEFNRLVGDFISNA
ncbi:alpha/beta hydrolase [Burkholderia sp. BCC1999]|uniref:alpha/beta fold hydrolase n=1 Tax=Burkholderia sp. BCC1999 TaxID=2817448 RepID=UPI002AC36AEA|nr:alpha/beta hydrolase [Burkholderia sp. BCC1999]